MRAQTPGYLYGTVRGKGLIQILVASDLVAAAGQDLPQPLEALLGERHLSAMPRGEMALFGIKPQGHQLTGRLHAQARQASPARR